MLSLLVHLFFLGENLEMFTNAFTKRTIKPGQLKSSNVKKKKKKAMSKMRSV